MSKPNLILLPGLHGTADLFYPLLDVLPGEITPRILAYPTDRCRSYAHHYRRVEKELAGESDLVLFAESFSGPLAVRFAAAHPDRVRALILCGTFITNPVPRILCYLAAVPLLLSCPIPSFAIRLFLAGANAPSQIVRDARRAIGSTNPIVLTHRVQQAAWLDARADLQNCRVPMLCIAGTRDRLVGQRSVRRIRHVRADIPIVALDAPHFVLQSRPAEVWQHVEEFLASIDSRVAAPPDMLPVVRS